MSEAVKAYETFTKEIFGMDIFEMATETNKQWKEQRAHFEKKIEEVLAEYLTTKDMPRKMKKRVRKDLNLSYGLYNWCIDGLNETIIEGL